MKNFLVALFLTVAASAAALAQEACPTPAQMVPHTPYRPIVMCSPGAGGGFQKPEAYASWCGVGLGSGGQDTHWTGPTYNPANPYYSEYQCVRPDGYAEVTLGCFRYTASEWALESGQAATTETVCNAGYTLYGDLCKSTEETSFDAALISDGGSVARNQTTGVLSGVTSVDVGTWSVSSSDSQGRPTVVIGPDSVPTTYTYEGISSRFATRTDYNGTTTYTWTNDGMGIATATLPDGSKYTFVHDETQHPATLTNVLVANGFVGGARAGTLAPWGIAIPYVTASLEQVPADTMLALLMKGLEVPFFHAEPVGVQPYANMATPNGVFILSYGESYSTSKPVVPLMDPLLPSPVQDACQLAEGGTMTAGCRAMFVRLMSTYCPGGRCSPARGVRIINIMIAAGCGMNGNY